MRVSKMDTPAVISWVRVSAGGHRLNNERGRVSPKASPKGPQQGRVSDAALGDRPIKAPDSCSGARNRSSNRPDPNQAWFLGAVGRQTAPWGGGRLETACGTLGTVRQRAELWRQRAETACGTLETACGTLVKFEATPHLGSIPQLTLN